MTGQNRVRPICALKLRPQSLSYPSAACSTAYWHMDGTLQNLQGFIFLQVSSVAWWQEWDRQGSHNAVMTESGKFCKDQCLLVLREQCPSIWRTDRYWIQSSMASVL